ncbi:DUF2786 domain-containing protein [Erwinia mallotivora]|uniref:DUF2786 domain-containing protein n=1 Tax=Erwinia mallotivora TaxID=69222 RepID=UPI0021C1FF49|nr:DUF2786 domain-containing protein [Erwinia mallotivora]
MNNPRRQARLLNLVRKLLALSRNNNNAHEAGLALQRAQQLMARYGISELDAGLANVKEMASSTAPSDAKKVPEWMISLVRCVSHGFGCRAYYSWRLTSSGYSRSVTFYGFSEKPEIAAYAFDVLTRQLKDATSSYLSRQSKKLKLATRRARAEQFRDGWVSGVRRVIHTHTVPAEEQHILDRWLESQEMKTVATRELKSCRGASLAREQGYQAGRNARLHQGVSGQGQQAIGYRQDNRGK